MPAVFQKTVEQDLHKPLKIQYCADTVFTKDNTGNLINVLLFEDGVPYNGGGTVSATAIRADGATESWAGTISGNTVSVALTRAALDVPGTLQVFIKVTAGTVETTVYAGVYNVVCTETPTVVAPVTPSDVATLIASIEAAIRNIPADWTSFLGTIAPTFEPDKTGGYAAGAYVWYPGQPDNVGTLYRFTSAHSGTWTGTDAVTVVIGNELNDTVRYTAQVHTDEQKTVARSNIGAASADQLSSLGYQVSVNTTDIDVIQRTIGSGLDPNNTVKSQLDGIKADIGTVPDGQNLQGEVADLKSAIEQQRSETTTSDILITDETGFIGARIKKGFNSSDVLQKDDIPDWIADGASAVSVADKSGSIAVSVGKNMQPRFVSNLTGKRISVLGDSISTYDAVGYKMPAIEDDHTQFFPRYNVNSLDKMWYSIVCKTIGASMLKSASWGGSMVSGTGSVADGKPGWSDARIAALADGSTVPDIVLVEMGTNDFDTGKALGSFDGSSPLPTTIQTGGTFSDAYALMISKIHAAYPMARIVCMTIIARKSVNDSETIGSPEYPVKNSRGLCVDDYNNVIRNIAHYMNCAIADTYACGINPWNIPIIESGASYGTILGDRFVHPNVAGMRMMAETVVNTLRKM